MNDLAIQAVKLSKNYRLGEAQKYKALRDVLADIVYAPFRILRSAASSNTRSEKGSDDTLFSALKDVSFDVRKGEVVGVIGRNGAGKTTLLKVLSRVTRPTAGHAVVRGRMGSLIDLGTGFHPELTGRENIFLNGSILGMKKREIDLKFDEIVEFAEIEKFLDTPVKRYSAGMYLRLAFAVAAHLDPEILLIDEVLAVGDHAFQAKCMRKMQDVGESGRTILFVSHNLAAVRAICPRTLWVSEGSIAADGETNDVIEKYIEESSAAITSGSLVDHPGRWKGMQALLQHVEILNSDSVPVSAISAGAGLKVRVQLKLSSDLGKVHVSAGVHDHMGDRIAFLSSFFQDSFVHGKPRFTAICEIPSLPLVPGRYFVWLWVEHGKSKVDVVENAAEFEVIPSDFFGSSRLPEGPGRGKVLLESRWSAEESDGRVDTAIVSGEKISDPRK